MHGTFGWDTPQILDAVFKAYDIRGTVPDEIDARFAHSLGMAAGARAREQGARSMVVGRDGRLSSVELAAALQGVLEDCRSEAPRLVQQLAQALEGRDLAAARRAAHTLRALRRLLGAEAVGTAAERVESLIGTGQVAAAQGLLPGLERDISEMLSEVRARLDGNERVRE